ncbi:MAG: hypothetical protein LBG05_01925 [Treponema sp.]|nr:hypothetical protein [Treponema sp.]
MSVYGLPMMEEQTEISPLTPEGQVPEAPPLTLPLTEPPRSSARRLPELMELNAPVMYSRTVKADVGQQVEIPFGGNGWVFLGEKTGQTGVSYQSHRFDAEGQTFLFEAERNGVYELEFYKQDFIRDFLIDDHIKVIIESAVSAGSDGNAKISRSPVVAQPRWPTIAQESAWAAGDKAGAMPLPPTELPSVQTTEKASQAVDGKTVPQEQTSAVLAMTSKVTAPESGVLENEGPDAYLEQARKAFDVNDLVSVLGVLDQFSERFPSGNDEAWWLYARAFEANGPTKDVKSARYYYQRLVTEFPLSSHWTDAQNRIKYLDRYYFNIQ